MSVVTIVGAGMMGSALAFPARENGHEVRLVGTHLDREIIETCKRTGRHPKFERDFPAGIRYCHIEEMEDALSGADLVIGGVSSFGVDWFGEHVLPAVPEETPFSPSQKACSTPRTGNCSPIPRSGRRGWPNGD